MSFPLPVPSESLEQGVRVAGPIGLKMKKSKKSGRSRMRKTRVCVYGQSMKKKPRSQ